MAAGSVVLLEPPMRLQHGCPRSLHVQAGMVLRETGHAASSPTPCQLLQGVRQAKLFSSASFSLVGLSHIKDIVITYYPYGVFFYPWFQPPSIPLSYLKPNLIYPSNLPPSHATNSTSYPAQTQFAGTRLATSSSQAQVSHRRTKRAC